MIDEAVTEIAHPVKPDLLIASRDIHPVPFGNSVATDTSADVLLKNVPAEDAIFGCYFHVDAAQGFGKELDPLRHRRIDLISISGHKLFAPKGIGALVVNAILGMTW